MGLLINNFRRQIGELYKDACVEGLLYDISSCSDAELLEMYVRNPIFSLERDIPKVAAFSELDDELLSSYGVIVNRTFDKDTLEWGADKIHKGVYILNRCNGSLVFDKGEVIRLYVSNGCELDIKVSNKSIVSIVSFGYSKLKVSNSKAYCAVTCTQYSEVKTKGKIRVSYE